MATAVIKEQRVNFYMDVCYVEQLKALVKNKTIPSMSKFCQEAVKEKLLELEQQQKILLMQQAETDPDYQERCQDIQKDFAAIDYEGQVNSEW